MRGALVSLLALPQGLAPAQLQAVRPYSACNQVCSPAVRLQPLCALQVRDLHARVAAAEGEAAALACLAAAEPGGGRGAPGDPAAGQSDGGSAPPDRLQAQKAQRWQGLRSEALRALEQLGLELQAREPRPCMESAEARTGPADAAGS